MMRIKKPLSALALALLAANSHAVITPGTLYTQDSSAIVVIVGSDGSYVYDIGLEASDFVNGAGGYLDVSIGVAAVGTLQGVAMFGTLACNSTCVGGLGYFDPGFGYVSLTFPSTGSTGVISPGDVVSRVSAMNTYIGRVSAGGFFQAGTLDHLGDQPFAFQLNLIGDPLYGEGIVWVETFDLGHFNFEPIASIGSSELIGNNLYIGHCYPEFCAPFNVDVPVPAAAWLFGSGLLGLAGLRRRMR